MILAAPHERTHDGLPGRDAAVEIPERLLCRFPVEDRRMARMRNDTADVVAHRDLPVERRCRIERHQQCSCPHARDHPAGDLPHQDVRHSENDDIRGGRPRLSSGTTRTPALLQVLQPPLRDLDVVDLDTNT